MLEMSEGERAAAAAQCERNVREEFEKYVGKKVLVQRIRANNKDGNSMTVYLSPAVPVLVEDNDTHLFSWSTRAWVDPMWDVALTEANDQLENCTDLHIFATSYSINGDVGESWYAEYTWRAWFVRLLRKWLP